MFSKQRLFNIFTWFPFFFLFFLSFFLFVCLVFSIFERFGEFEYTTFSGDIGIASFCTVSYGRSSCRTNDGTIIMVESFTKK